MSTHLQTFIEKNWGLNVRAITPASGGLVNQSHWIQTDQGSLVLQRLHPVIYSRAKARNYERVTHWLIQKNIPAPQLVPTKQKIYWIRDGESAWRLLKPVPGIVRNEITTDDQAYEIGKTLGRFHLAIQGVGAQLEPGYAGHQYPAVLRKLDEMLKHDSFRIAGLQKNAVHLFEEIERYMLPTDLPRRVIHGDTKFTNFVFADGLKAKAMIDLDTVQIHSPLFDIADAIRSACATKEDAPANQLDLKRKNALLSGYQHAAPTFLSAQEQHFTLNALALVTAGLAARFLMDIIDDNYFGWDPKRFGSRKEHNRVRMNNQLMLHESVVAAMA